MLKMKGLLVTSIFIAGVSGFGFYVFQSLNETKRYVRDHECVVIDKKPTTTFQTIPQANGTMVTMPITTMNYLYECQIEGKHGTRFWY